MGVVAQTAGLEITRRMVSERASERAFFSVSALLFAASAAVTKAAGPMRTHLIHRPARDIIPPLGGARVSSYRI